MVTVAIMQMENGVRVCRLAGSGRRSPRRRMAASALDVWKVVSSTSPGRCFSGGAGGVHRATDSMLL
jgi:hypothetical protein